MTAAGGSSGTTVPQADAVAPRAADERTAAVALAFAPRIGSVRFRELVGRYGSAVAALESLPAAVRQGVRREAEAALTTLARSGGSALALGQPGYPVALLDLPDPPPVLYAVGRLELLAHPAVAIVGTRRATRGGIRAARHLAEAVARAGGVVMSGMARGIDGEAHQAALHAGGDTAAVLGTGVDMAYPRAHVALHRAIAARGLVLSELPPGERADAGSFPRRNRLIAALARVTLVVEAPHRSGALITAAHALELGRTVAAVPGPIDSVECAGSNLLLRDGAQVITDAADLLQLAGLHAAAPTRHPELEGPAADVWRALADGSPDVETLVERTGLPTRVCLTALAELELAGLVECALTGEVARR
ncbi:MAG TPA: DNA-processing protein DprA [Gemmatimonadaceae bacterium]|nr:DNA-processing protein DprA [Gemmatimonadaceae bacterium]